MDGSCFGEVLFPRTRLVRMATLSQLVVLFTKYVIGKEWRRAGRLIPLWNSHSA